MIVAPKIRFNDYIIEGNIAKIKLGYKGTFLWTIIDLEDLERLIDLKYRWCARYEECIRGYYALCNIYPNGIHTVIAMHQFILNYFGGDDIDHKNNDSLDNRKSNLRIISHKDNSKNRKGKNINNTTGYRNVSFYKGKYIVQLQVEGKNKLLGSFDNAIEAGEFSEKMRREYYGEFFGKS